MYFWLFGVFIAAQTFLWLQWVGAAFQLRSPALGRAGCSSCSSPALEHRLSRSGPRAQLLCGMWNLPRSGIQPVSPVGRFSTAEPPEKPDFIYFLRIYLFTWLRRVFIAAFRIFQLRHGGVQFSDSRVKPLHQEHRVLATRPPGESSHPTFLMFS